MGIPNFSTCTRCGKQRVAVRTYEEIVGTSSVTCTETACPDKDCQKLVDATLMEEEQRRNKFIDSSNSRNKPGNKKKAN